MHSDDAAAKWQFGMMPWCATSKYRLDSDFDRLFKCLSHPPLQIVASRNLVRCFHDLGTFPGFEAVRRTQHTTAVFENERVSLTVVMANHLSLEKQRLCLPG